MNVRSDKDRPARLTDEIWPEGRLLLWTLLHLVLLSLLTVQNGCYIFISDYLNKIHHLLFRPIVTGHLTGHIRPPIHLVRLMCQCKNSVSHDTVVISLYMDLCKEPPDELFERYCQVAPFLSPGFRDTLKFCTGKLKQFQSTFCLPSTLRRWFEDFSSLVSSTSSWHFY